MKGNGKPVQPLSAWQATRANRVAGAFLDYSRKGFEPASMRALPPPFEGWCSISSDADSPNMEGFLSTGKLLREKFALPISDSTFPHWIFNQGLVADDGIDPVFPDFGKGSDFDFETFLNTCGPWLRHVYRGRIDTIHGWLLRQMVRIGDDVVLGKETTGPAKPVHAQSRSKELLTAALRKARRAVGPVRHRIDFRLPEGWHFRAPPRYCVFKLRAPTYGYDAKIAFVDGNQDLAVLDLMDIRSGSPESLTHYLIDLHEHVSRDAEVLKRLDAELRIIGNVPFFELRDPMLVTWLRDDIAEQMDLFEALNIRLNTYTSHGGGYNLGHFQAPNIDAADRRGMADNPDNPYYAMDLFDDFGLRFFNSANNTSQSDPVRLGGFLLPKTLNDGETVYDFHRFNHAPKDAEGNPDTSPFEMFGNIQNPSMANLCGWQIDALIDQISASDHIDLGGVVYTHLLAKCADDPERFDRSFDGLFNDPTSRALIRLAQSYYGIEGRQEAEKTDRRIFVAPQANLLRHAQLMREVGRHSSYDRANNSIHVSNWHDAVSNEMIPTETGGTDSLRYLTFHVEDAATARLFVDGIEHQPLIRNSADESGRESITVADAGAPTVIMGQVPIAERHDRSLQTDKCRLIGHTVVEGHCFELTDDDAEIVINASALELADHQAIRLVATGELSGLDWSCEISGTIAGQKLGFTTAQLESGQNACVFKGPDPGKLHDIVVPFHILTSGTEGAQFPGWAIRSIKLRIEGGAGRSININRLELLNDEPRVRTPLCVVGGRVSGDQKLERVIMISEGNRYETQVTSEGWFHFLNHVPRNSIVEIFGEGEDVTRQLIPHSGRLLEVTRDTMEVDFGGLEPGN